MKLIKINQGENSKYQAKYIESCKGDCAIRALATSTGLNYDTVFEMISDFIGGTPVDKFSNFQLNDFLMQKLNYEIVSTRKKKIASIAKEIKNCIIIYLQPHVVAIKGGNLYDTFDSTNYNPMLIFAPKA